MRLPLLPFTGHPRIQVTLLLGNAPWLSAIRLSFSFLPLSIMCFLSQVNAFLQIDGSCVWHNGESGGSWDSLLDELQCLLGLVQLQCLADWFQRSCAWCWHCCLLAGYAGQHCEKDVDECATNPCHNGGVCFERSDPAYYGTRPDFPSNFSYSQAAGFLCWCQPGFTGERCRNCSSCLHLTGAAWFEQMGVEQCYLCNTNHLMTGT